jgi:hypothetical protein
MTAKHARLFIKDPWLKITPPNQFNDLNEFAGRASLRPDLMMAKLIMSDWGSRTMMANIFNRLFNWNVKQGDLPAMAKGHPKIWKRLVRIYLNAHMAAHAQTLPDIISRSDGVACFTEDPKNGLMWAHYADASRGIVIGFDSADKFFHACPLKPVIYSRERVIIPGVQCSRRSFFSKMDRLIRTKSIDFKYEREWRICLPLAKCKKRRGGMFLRRIRRVCIKEIIIGPRCSLRDKRSIEREVAESLRHIRVNVLMTGNRNFRLRFDKPQGLRAEHIEALSAIPSVAACPQ